MYKLKIPDLVRSVIIEDAAFTTCAFPPVLADFIIVVGNCGGEQSIAGYRDGAKYGD